MKLQRVGTVILVLLLALAQPPANHAGAQATDYTVTHTGDVGEGSLRWAINQTNIAGGGNILFAISGAGVHTIQPLTPLPALSGDNTTIDGYSQPGATVALGPSLPATILIEIDGSVAGPGNGLSIVSAGNTIKGLAINRFDWSGVAIGGSSAVSNTISGNYIGTDASGTVDYGNGRDGVSILLGAQNNTIGGPITADRNIISGNGWDGVGIVGDNTTGNVVARNYIGAAVDGWNDLGNSRHGVHIYGGAHHNTIGGGELSSSRNVISGNDQDGIHIVGANTSNNVVTHNYIGLARNGETRLENGGAGVSIADGAHENAIGGDRGFYAESNIISGNVGAGVVISGTQTTTNTVSGNYIGSDANGMASRSNLIGVKIVGGAQNNTIGGSTEGEGNFISGNQESGIVISGDSTSGNVVTGNAIGVAPYYQVDDMGNAFHGIYILAGAHDNVVGPDNVIAHNDRNGVRIYNETTISNTVSGNSVYSNTYSGVYIGNSAQGNTVGGDTGVDRNFIYGNGAAGVAISDEHPRNNIVSGNYIGIDELGNAAGNGTSGIYLSEAADNTIADNVISANTEHGIYITEAWDNTITGNIIGPTANGALWPGFGNGQDGIRVSWSPAHSTGNTIGGSTAGAGNVIAGNWGQGVCIADAGLTGNPITHNSIYGNVGDGIAVPAFWTPAAPVIVSTDLGSSIEIVGTACAGCTVEVFQNSDDDGEGEAYVGDATADAGGTFTITVSALTRPYLTATATDASNTTSEFSAAFAHTVHSVFLPLALNGY